MMNIISSKVPSKEVDDHLRSYHRQKQYQKLIKMLQLSKDEEEKEIQTDPHPSPSQDSNRRRSSFILEVFISQRH